MRFFVAALREFCPDVMERSTRHPQTPEAISLELNVSHLCRCRHCLVFGVFLKKLMVDVVLLRLLDCCLPLLWGEQNNTAELESDLLREPQVLHSPGFGLAKVESEFSFWKQIITEAIICEIRGKVADYFLI